MVRDFNCANGRKVLALKKRILRLQQTAQEQEVRARRMQSKITELTIQQQRHSWKNGPQGVGVTAPLHLYKTSLSSPVQNVTVRSVGIQTNENKVRLYYLKPFQELLSIGM
jgi:hypothetical protein